MTSSAETNLPESDTPAREGQLIGARVSTDEVQLIDLARVTAGYSTRQDFIAAAVIEKARDILGRSAPAKAS